MRHFGGDSRGVSIAITHALTLAITAMVIVGLLIGAASILEGERDRGSVGSMEIIGERLASEISSVDRLADSHGGNVTKYSAHPSQVAGSSYIVEVSSACSSPVHVETQYCLRLTTTDDTSSVTIPLSNSTAVELDTSVMGGDLVIGYQTDTDTITIEEDRP